MSRVAAESVLRIAMRLVVPALATLALAGCEKDEPAVETTPRTTENDVLADISGEWRGELHQDRLKPFEVHALIRNPGDPRESLVRYDGAIECSGTWTLMNVRDRTVRFLESIDRRQDAKCKGTGTVEISSVPNGNLHYLFRGGGVESIGTLRRVE